MDLIATLTRLGLRRPLFHSEADFQHELAWELRGEPDVEHVRLERPLEHAGERPNLDLLLHHRGRRVAGELKYWTRRLEFDGEGEHYRLKNQAAQDLSRYDFWKDVARLERLVRGGALHGGFVVAITNDAGYWNAGKAGTVDADFRLDSGRTVEGRLGWGPTASAGTMRRREHPIELLGRYITTWRPYSRVGRVEFRWLIAEVDCAST